MRTTLILLASLTTACSQDIILQELPDLNAGVDGTEEDPVVDGSDTTDPTDPTDPADPTNEVDQDPEPIDDPPPEDDCAATSDLIYVIDRADEAIYTFDPVSTEFSFVGALDCGMFEGTPASMAVDRDGTAWVRYSSNTLFAVDLDTMACTATSAAGGFGSYGMGYATENGETWRDDLYVANRSTLARIDASNGQLVTVGALPSQSELTGNAAGELWAFLPLEQPAQLVRLDKNNAEVLQNHSLPAFTTSNLDTFAFATWGSEFYLFVRYYGMGSTTDVYRVSASGQMTLLAGDTGMDVVGAGVSTCAPT